MFNLSQQQREAFRKNVKAAVGETRVWLHRAHIEGEGAVAKVANRLMDCAKKAKISAPWLTTATIEAVFHDYLDPKARHIDTFGPAEPFAAVATASDLELWASEIADALLTLPRKYEAWVETPVEAEGAVITVDLSDAYQLVALSPAVAAEMPIHAVDGHRAERYHRSYPSRVVHERFYFVARFEGYLREHEPTPEIDEVVNAYNGLLGLLLVEGPLAFELMPSCTPPRARPITLYRIEGASTRELLPYQWFTQEDSWLVHDLTCAGRRDELASAAVASVSAAFSDPATRTAARWYLDSFSRSTGLMQIVQATIALEILLGDREKDEEDVGLSALLANRLAYLTGYTPAHRREISADFKRLYDLRSRIVHAGQNRLNDDERKALKALQRHTRNALHAEIEGFRTERDWKRT